MLGFAEILDMMHMQIGSTSSLETSRARKSQGCQIFLGTTYQNGKERYIPNDHKIYIPNGHKIDQMALK
jgi:hypothetical protein